MGRTETRSGSGGGSGPRESRLGTVPPPRQRYARGYSRSCLFTPLKQPGSLRHSSTARTTHSSLRSFCRSDWLAIIYTAVKKFSSCKGLTTHSDVGWLTRELVAGDATALPDCPKDLAQGSSDFSGRLHLFLEDEVRSVVL